MPPHSFFQRLAEVRGRGGFGVVAVDDEGRIVGEANYELLPDGDGELGMAVARDWRGWLGAYLLDTLVDAAAARGVPNIEADVLVTNRRMLSLLRTAAAPTLPSDDWVSLRLMVGTAGHTPVARRRAGHARSPAPGCSSRRRGRWRARSAASGGRRAGGDHVLRAPRAAPRVPGPRRPALPLAAGADAVVVAALTTIAGRRWSRPPTCTRAFRCASRPSRADLAVPAVEQAARAASAHPLPNIPSTGGASCTP